MNASTKKMHDPGRGLFALGDGGYYEAVLEKFRRESADAFATSWQVLLSRITKKAQP